MKINVFIDLLCCPECNTHLIQNESNILCPVCNSHFHFDKQIFLALPKQHKENNYNMDYLNHYSKDAEIFDYFEERTSKVTEHDERRVREYILSLMNLKGKLILDVGSGSAWVAKYLSKNNQVISFDIAETNISKALEKFPSTNHYGVVGDALKSPFRQKIFDYVISSEVIEHIVHPNEFITNLITLLKPSGSLIISTPYKELLHYSQCIHCNNMTPKNAHLHSFDEYILVNFANDLVEKVKYYIFGNKALILLRTYVLLKYLPLELWKLIDKIANLIIRKKSHIIVVYRRKKEINNE